MHSGLVVDVFHVGVDGGMSLQEGFVAVSVDLFKFDGSEEALHEGVFLRTARGRAADPAAGIADAADIALSCVGRAQI